MEPLQGDTVTNDSCSCTSYDYNSESDCQTLIRLLAQGCRINRLFNGKNVPLRESKLLDKLIITRALYDALRSQLLSNSVSVSSISNLKPGQQPKENKKSLEAKKSGDIFSLVDLVDKGVVLGSRKLSVCCSCCNCNSKAHLHESGQKGRRNRHVGAYVPSRSSVTSKYGAGEELKLGKQFKAKNIKSDPCTRAGKLEELIKLKLQSRVMLKKIRPEQPQDRDQHPTIPDKHNFLTTNNEKIRKSYHTLKRYKARPTQYIENMGEGGIDKIRKWKPNKYNYELKTMSSIEKLKMAEQKIKDSFIADQKATQKSKPEGDSISKNIVERSGFSPTKNVVIKFKDQVSEKRQLQDWELQNTVGQKKNDQSGNLNSGTPNLGVRKEQYAIPGRIINKQQKSPPRKRMKNDTTNKKENKNISSKFNKVTHAIAKSIKLQKPKESDPSLVLRDKKKSDKSINSNSGVRSEQYASPRRTPTNQKSPPRIRNQNDTTDISKVYNKDAHGKEVSTKLQKPKDSHPSLVLRDKKKSAKSMSSIQSNLGVRKDLFASPGRIATKQQKSPLRKHDKNGTLDEKEKATQDFNKLTHAIGNSIKLRKRKELYPYSVLKDKKNSAKSMTSITSPEILNKMEKLPLSSAKEKKPIKSRIKRKPGELLKSISTTSIEKFSFENRKARQTLTKKSSLNFSRDKNIIKSDPSIQVPNKKKLSHAPMRFMPRERLHKKTTIQHVESHINEDPDQRQKPLKTKKKQKKKSAKSHALKRCLCSLKIKVKKTKSAITKIVTGELQQVKDTLSNKLPDSTTNNNFEENQEIQSQSLHKDNLESKDRKPAKCECSDTDMDIKQIRGSHNDPLANTHSTIKPSNDKIAKAKNHPAHIISLNVASKCGCIDTKKKGSLKYKKTNTHTGKIPTIHAYTETKEKFKHQNHSVQTMIKVTTKDKQSGKLYPGQKNKATVHHETKSLFNRITKCKCPIVIKENIIVSSKNQEMSVDCVCEPISGDFSKKVVSKDRFKKPLQSQSVYKDSLQLKKKKNMSQNASKCECSDADNVNIEQNRGSNNEICQTKTHPMIKSSSNVMTAKDKNHHAHINTPDQAVSLNVALECECLSTEEKGSLEYNQTNTITRKPTNHVSTETKATGKLQNLSVQTINHITINKEKKKRKLYLGHKTDTKQHETKSIFNRITICKCPIAIKENINLSSQNQEMSDDCDCKPISAELSKRDFSKDGFIIPLYPNSTIEQTDIYKNGAKMKHMQKKQSQLSNSTGKLKYTAAKHGLRKLKFGKFEKKNNKFRKKIKDPLSTFTVSKSEYPKTQPNVISISISRERREIDHNKVELNKSKVKQARKPKKHSKVSKNRSYSSLPSRSAQLHRPKKVHSILASYKSEIPIQDLQRNKLNLHVNTTQHVGSSFYRKKIHKKISVATYSPLTCQCKDSKMMRASKESPFKNHDLEKYEKYLQRSSLLKEGKLDKSALLSSTIRRCICTLKLHKKNKRKKKDKAVATDSDTLEEKMYPDIKRPIRSPINIGIDTVKPKMISKSSDTRKLPNSSKLLFINSDLKKRPSLVQKLRNLNEYTELQHLPKHDKPKYLKESLRQGVELGSNISFNIEFYKDTITEKKNIAKRLNNMNVYFSNNSQETKHFKIDESVKSCLKTTEVTLIPSVSKTGLIVKDEQRRGNIIIPFIIEKPTQVYTVSTVAVAQSNINIPEIILPNEVNLVPRCVDSCHLGDGTENSLNKMKQRQYLKKQSLSSVFSIAFKSKSIQSYTSESKCNLLQISSLNQSLLDFTSKETMRFESKFGFGMYFEKNVRRPVLRSAHSEIDSFPQEKDEQKNLEIPQETKKYPTITKKNTNPPQLTGIQQFLRRSYCTMNIQIAQPSPKRRHHQQYPTKLKDYECEPGVCIPYECDPNECQKMIMKRLMRKVSRMSGTENRMKTSASITSSIKSCDDKCSGKKTKLQSSSAGERRHRTAKVRHTGLRYQTLPRSPVTQKQAVRIGSNFSFNMEFFKGSSKSSPTAEIIKEPIRRSTTRSSYDPYRRRRDRGTGYEVGQRHRESQSRMKQMQHRGSSVTPMLRRCFCTLKLQKKGRQQKERELQIIHQGTSTPPKFYVEKPILRTTETSQNTKVKKRFPEILPYECEPNTCIPGECDPYECLEIIKRRRNKYTRDLGTDSMKSRITSSSSMTSNPRRTKRRHVQSRNTYVNQTRSGDTVVRSRPSVTESQVTPTRQAVRLGSSFSFNIEFFKDNTSPADINMRSPEIYEHKPLRHQVRKVPKHVYARHKVRESSSQNRKSTHDTHSQIGLIKRGQSTMTGAFLKRCFCTAKLQGVKVDTEPKESQQRTSFSTMKRCLCHLKALTGKKEPNKTATAGNEQVTPRLEKHVAKTQTRTYSPILEPYECEPGVCVPGLCDPYECEKIIRKRRAKEKGVGGAMRPRTKSTSSSFTSSKTSKARMTQSKADRHYERTRKQNLSSRDMAVKDQFRTQLSPQKQVVKIASNFSFNIEFYKDNMSNLSKVQEPGIPVRKSRPTRDQAHEARKRNRTKDKRLMGRGSSVYTRGSQMDVTKTKDQSLGPILKRCFCTLKLHKEKNIKKEIHSKKEKKMNQGTATPVIKEVPTLQTRSMMTANKYKALPYKLKPYECEPGVCVPGECDPIECDKRIKRRLMNRASGTLTDRHRTRSTASTIRPRRRYRDRDVQSMRHTRPERTRDIHHKVKRPERRTKVVERDSKQAVNIGSNFSFNMEFFKERSPGGSIENSRRMKQYGTHERPRRTASRSTEWRSSSRNRKAQSPRTVRDMDSQVLARKMRSTMTGVGPFLKRCFCTLQLHKSEKDKKFNKTESVSTKTENIKIQPNLDAKHEHTSTITRPTAQIYNRKLEPYECEPGVCIPGECDPYECEKRIKRRMQSKQSSTDPHGMRSVSSSIAESTKSRHRRIQAWSSTPSGNQFRAEGRVHSSDSSPNRQAVRIGSSFSFNVEFYKDKSPELPSARDVRKIIKRGIKGTDTQPKRLRSTSSYSKRGHTRHCQSQSDCTKTECKSSCAPLLKRCFCTLKLQKMGKQQQDIRPKIEPSMRTMGTRTPVRNKVEIQPVAREIGTKTKRYNHLEPYECEPGVCVPGLCDPYECEKRIKMRNMKDFGTGMNRASMKSMYSLTSREMGTKAMNTLRGKKRPPTQRVFEVKKPPPPSRGFENVNRQSVHLGSNFSFNLEFFKDRSSDQGGIHHDDIQTHYKPRARKTSMSSANRIKLRNQGSHGRQKSLYHRQLQTSAQTESRGSGMGQLKRCFCTLTLQRAEVKNNLSSPVSRNIKVKTQDKKTSTKKYNASPVPLQLEPYECEPNVCTPGDCNPYECLERIKKRGMRRISRTTGTRMKRTSQVSVSSMAAQFMPGYTSKRSQFKGEGFSPQKVERIVEEPRFAFLRGSPNRQGVKISSNFSFNIEFFKEVSTPGMAEVAKKCQGKEICTECKKTGYSTNTRVGQHGTRNYLHDNESQSETVKTEDKSSAVAMLRRCFCTAKLHRSHLARSQRCQSLTVGRVEEVRPLTLFGPREYWVQYQIQPATKNTKSEKTQECLNIKSTTTNNKRTDSYKLETIMSYTPKKFDKNNDTIQQKPKVKESETTTSTLRKMLKCCKNLFVGRIHNKNNEEDNYKRKEVKCNKYPRIDILKASKSERHPYNVSIAAIKKSKSLKVAKMSEKNIYKKKYSRFESGDAIEGNNASNNPHKTRISNVKKSFPNCHVCKKHFPLKQVHFAISPSESSKSIIKPLKESKSVSFLYKGSTFKKSENFKKLCSYCGGFKREKLLLPGLDTTNTVSVKENYILPRTREKDKISCPCCICRKKQTRIKTKKHDTYMTNTEKQNPNGTKTVNVKFIPRKKNLADEQYSDSQKNKTKKCVCENHICASGSRKETLVKKSGYMCARREKKEEKTKGRQTKLLELRFKKEDKEIMKRRKLNDSHIMKKLKKYKETSDIMLLAESFLNICKLGITSARDIIRNIGRIVIDQKRTYRNVISFFRKPMRTLKKFQVAAHDRSGESTLKRVKIKLKALTCPKRGREQLVAYPVTNFVLRANYKDPRRRFQPKKLKQPRRDPGAGCSTFVLSVRMRPWLSVYHSCAWFHPHCLRVLRVWRSFMDVMLFLLTATVSSPCILCMELSRVSMCCFLCTR